MDDTRQRLREVGRRAPAPSFDLTDVRARKDRRELRRRTGAGVLGIAITAGLVIGGLSMIGAAGDGSTILDGGQGLPTASDPPRALAPGEYAYQRVHIYTTCGEPDVAPGRGCADTLLRAEAWWALDDSGRRVALARAGAYGFQDTGRFGPGTFPDEGDLSAFPTDPGALEAFLLDRSSPDGASPRPDVTPAPGVPLEQGLLWNAIRDYLGSTQYLNVTPEIRAAMLRVLATAPMVQVTEGAVDPLGRPAVVLRFPAYGGVHEVFVDPRTGDFLAHVERYEEPIPIPADGSGGGVTPVLRVTLIEEAGFTGSDDEQPRAGDRTVAPV